MNIMNNV